MYKKIINITKTKTKEEFLNDEIIIEDCPSDYGLKDNKKFCGTNNEEYDCKGCWKQTIETVGIEFKEEVAEPTPIKEYTISDLINSFPEETEFIISGNTKYKILKDNLYHYSKFAEKWLKSEFTIRETLSMKFTKVEEPKLKPMRFEEAVRTGNKIKYEFFNDKQDKFYPPNETIQSIIELYPIKTTAIILEGTWFAEGVYE
jgi:hypothetical protein